MYATPPSSPPAPSAERPGGYEIILSADGSILELAPGTAYVSGPMQCIQGAVSDNPADGFFAFLSIDQLQIPLVSNHKSSRVDSHTFRIEIPGRNFNVSLNRQTEPNVIAGMEGLLSWFTTFGSCSEPAGNHPPPTVSDIKPSPSDRLHHSIEPDYPANSNFPANPAYQPDPNAYANYAPGGSAPATSMNGECAASDAGLPSVNPPSQSNSRLDRAGVKGATIVTKYGEKLNKSLKARADASVAASANKPQKNVKLGGAGTASALNSAKKVVGTGAGLAATVIDKVSSAIGSGLANNKAMATMRDAPEGSQKRKTHDLLVSGAMAVGQVYIAADNQGKLIFETAGDGAGRVAGAKYGSEAEAATRATGRIALDGYRIFRFPNKLIASSLVRGAVKGSTAAAANAGRADGRASPVPPLDAYAGNASAGNPYLS